MLTIAAVVAAILALFTLSRNSGNKLNRACFGLFACLAVSHAGWVLIPNPAGLMAWMVAESWLPALIMRFGRRVGRGSSPKGGPVGWAMFLWAERAAILFAAISTLMTLATPQWLVRIDVGDRLLFTPMASWGGLVALMLLVATLLKLENLFRATQGEVRWRLKYLLLGCIALVAIRIYALTLAVLFGGISGHVGFELGVGTLVGGTMVAYAVVRHRLLNVDVFVSRYVIYNSITVAAVGAYLLIVGLVVWGLNRFEGDTSAVLISTLVFLSLTALGIGLLSETMRWRVRHFVDRNFYKNRHDYRHEWQAATQAVAAEHSVSGSVTALSRMTKQTLGVEYLVTLLGDGQSNRFVAPEGTEEGTDLSPLDGDDLVLDNHPRWGIGAHRVKVYRHRTRHAHVLFLPLQTGDALIGWVALGPRVGGIPYHLEDLELVSAMAAQTAVAVRNLQLGQALAESREQAALHQLSTFFIHDMKNTTNSLGMLAQNIKRNQNDPAFWADAEAGINRAVEQMNALTGRLRELREKGPINAVPLDLAELIRGCADQWRGRMNINLDIELEDRLICLGDAHLLESVLTNLILNAAEADARHIRVTGLIDNGTVQITVADDGHGMEQSFIDRELFRPFASTKQLGMGIGLFQARRIVEQLGGRLNVTSSKGRGSCFTITLPGAESPGTPSPASETEPWKGPS